MEPQEQPTPTSEMRHSESAPTSEAQHAEQSSLESPQRINNIAGFFANWGNFITHDKKYTLITVLFGAFYAVLSLVALAYSETNSIQGLTSLGSMGMRTLAKAAVCVVAPFILTSLLLFIWERYAPKGPNAKSASSLKPAPEPASAHVPMQAPPLRTWLLYALAIFAIWLIWIIPHYPGTVRDDTIPQMLQWFGYIDWYTQHPIADTAIFGTFFSLGDLIGAREAGLFIYILIQAALTALGFSAVLCYLQKNNVKHQIIILLLLFYAFARVIYQPIDTMSKDALSAVFFTPCALLFVEMVRSGGTALKSKPFCIAFGILFFLCVITKRTMLYVLLIAFAVYIIYALVRQSRNKADIVPAILIPAACTICALLVWSPLVAALTNAEKNPTYEMYSIPEQQVVRTLINDPETLSEEEYARLGEYFDIDQAMALYNPWRSDEVSNTVIDDPNVGALLETWLKLGIKHPDSYLAAFMDLTSGWYPLSNAIYFGHDSYDELQNEDRMIYWAEAMFDDDQQAADGFFSTINFQHPQFFSGILNVEEKLDRLQAYVPAYSSYGFYCVFLPLLLLIYGFATHNARLLVAASLPAALMISFLVGPIALYWYTIPMVYIFPLVVCIPLFVPSAPRS